MVKNNKYKDDKTTRKWYYRSYKKTPYKSVRKEKKNEKKNIFCKLFNL